MSPKPSQANNASQSEDSEPRTAQDQDADGVQRLMAFFSAIGYGVSSEERTRFRSFDEMSQGADVVIEGSVADVALSRVVQDGLPGRGVALLTVHVKPIRVLRGSLLDGLSSVPVEFGGSATTAEQMKRVMPDGSQLWFLHRKMEGPPGDSSLQDAVYRLESSQGLLADTPTGVVNPVGKDNYTSNGLYDGSLLQGTRTRILDPVLSDARARGRTTDELALLVRG